MSDEQRDALQRLERRVEVLEQMVRRLLPRGAEDALLREAPRPVPIARPNPPAAFTAPLAPPPPPQLQVPTAAEPDLEQWFGQRGLLVVGVLALLAATGFFLKYAFDRGWVPPVIRSAASIVAGVAVAAWGEARIRRGLRRYGAAMIGAGGGLAYLGLWAAAGPYGLIERRLGVLLLAACTVVVILLALRHEVEGLAIWALAGAYLAPLVLPPPTPNPQAFLGYLEVIGLGCGLLAYSMSWRRTYDLAIAGYFVLAGVGAGEALGSPLGAWFLAAGALLTLHVTLPRPWPEARLGALGLAWILFVPAFSDLPPGDPQRWLALGAAAAVWALLWWHGLETDRRQSPVEGFLFVVNPFVLFGLTLIEPPGLLTTPSGPAVVAALLAICYLIPGWTRRSPAHVLVGFALAALAVAEQWRPATVVSGWTVLAVLAQAAEQRAGRRGGRHAALGLAALALVWLFSVAFVARPRDTAAFADAWAIALYVYVAGTALLAAWSGEREMAVFWALCGAAVFAGGSIELERFFQPRTPLAGDLALSVYWLAYAAVLVWIGFDRDRKEVRSTGLVVAAGAGLKIALYDLSNLQALYRIASFFALALIALGVAYAYNKKASGKTVVENR